MKVTMNDVLGIGSALLGIGAAYYMIDNGYATQNLEGCYQREPDGYYVCEPGWETGIEYEKRVD